MLYDRIKALYEHARLEHYRKLFGRIREKDGSLSATEAYAADVIYLLGNPTLSTFAEVLGVSQPNATYKINNLAMKGYATRSASDSDRRECRFSSTWASCACVWCASSWPSWLRPLCSTLEPIRWVSSS